MDLLSRRLSGGTYRPRGRARSPALLLLWLLLPGASLRSLEAQPAAAPGEYELKAVFISNFLQYVDWPESAFESSDSPLVLGVVGDDPFGASIDEIVARLPPIAGRAVKVTRLSPEDPVDGLQVVFVARTESGARELGDRLCGRPVLTIGEIEGFAEAGGIINFFTERNRIRFEINPRCAKAGGLRMSAQLLKLARIVDPGSSPGES